MSDDLELTIALNDVARAEVAASVIEKKLEMIEAQLDQLDQMIDTLDHKQISTDDVQDRE